MSKLPKILAILLLLPTASYAAELSQMLDYVGVSTAKMKGPHAAGIGSIVLGDKICANPRKDDEEAQSGTKTSGNITSAGANAELASMIGLPSRYLSAIESFSFDVEAQGIRTYDDGDIGDTVAAHKKAGCELLKDKKAKMIVRVTQGKALFGILLKEGVKADPLVDAVKKSLGEDFLVQSAPIKNGEKPTGRTVLVVYGENVILETFAVGGSRLQYFLK